MLTIILGVGIPTINNAIVRQHKSRAVKYVEHNCEIRAGHYLLLNFNGFHISYINWMSLAKF